MQQDYVLISGSVNSLATAILVAREALGQRRPEPVLLFADTGLEHTDTYRLVIQTAAVSAMIHASDQDVGHYRALIYRCHNLSQYAYDRIRALPRLQWLRIANNPLEWRISDPGANSARLPCAQQKRDVILNWLAQSAQPTQSMIHVGITWPERCAFLGSQSNPGLQVELLAKGWQSRAPLCEPPSWQPDDITELREEYGIKPHALSSADMDHNNCAGFCWRNGTRQWHRYLVENPDGYRRAEDYLDTMDIIAKDGKRFTLKQFNQSNPGLGLQYERRPLMCFSS